MSLLDSLAAGLLPASFRGVPFAVEEDSLGGGRRLAVHTYPGKDEPWPEDMGRATRSWRFRGFIVDGDILFAGGPITLQRALLVAALEKKGPGTLVHPTLGVLNVSVPNFNIGQAKDAASRSAVEITFVESGKQSFPSILSSSSGLLSAANLCDLAIAVDVARVVTLALGSGGQQADAVSTTRAWSAEVVAQGSDATSICGLAAQLPGNNGRFAGGANIGFIGTAAVTYGADTTVADLIADASAQRVAISTAGVAVATVVANLGGTTTADDIGPAIAVLVATLLAACADPADAVRLLTDLANFAPLGLAPTTPVGSAICAAFRRSAAVALARAAAQYQPASYDAAFALLAQLSDLLDIIATEAADAGDDGSYAALRAVKVAVVEDLRTRGASLAPIKTFGFNASLPAAVIAQRLYQDATRAEELVRETACIHPLFMPSTFQALAS